jgi:hypothetical protein
MTDFVTHWLNCFTHDSIISLEIGYICVKRQASILPAPKIYDTARARGSLVRWGTMLQSWKVACSIPDEVMGFLNLPIPSRRTMALGSTQRLRDMSTRTFFGGLFTEVFQLISRPLSYTNNGLFIAYFPYFEKKNRNRLMRSLCCLCEHLNVWTSEPMFMKLGMYVIQVHLNGYFINPWHQSVCLHVYSFIIARQRLRKKVTAATSTHAAKNYWTRRFQWGPCRTKGK